MMAVAGKHAQREKDSTLTDPATNHWSREGLTEALQDIIRESGRSLGDHSVVDLAPLDHFHGDGREATLRLARLLDPAPGTKVLDVGGALGGPARTLAVEFGCVVTVLDLTEDYVRAGEMLTAGLGLQDRVKFDLGNALHLPYPPESFDVVWTQNSGMNISDKAALYAGFRRVLRPGGRLATQEPVSGPNGPPIHFPLMWADDPGLSHVGTAEELVATITGAGFIPLANEPHLVAPGPLATFAIAGGQTYSIAELVKGDRLSEIMSAGKRNREEGRIASLMAVFERA